MMNHVNLIGQMSSEPKVIELEGGRKIAQFSMATKDQFLDENGNLRSKTNWHRISAWGKWVHVLEELGHKGLNLAIEGRLVSRFYHSAGGRVSVTEIEVNDLIIM